MTRKTKQLAIPPEKMELVIRVVFADEEQKRVFERYYNRQPDQGWRDMLLETLKSIEEGAGQKTAEVLDYFIGYMQKNDPAVGELLLSLRSFILNNPRPESVNRLIKVFPFVITGILDPEQIREYMIMEGDSKDEGSEKGDSDE